MNQFYARTATKKWRGEHSSTRGILSTEGIIEMSVLALRGKNRNLRDSDNMGKLSLKVTLAEGLLPVVEPIAMCRVGSTGIGGIQVLSALLLYAELADTETALLVRERFENYE